VGKARCNMKNIPRSPKTTIREKNWYGIIAYPPFTWRDPGGIVPGFRGKGISRRLEVHYLARGSDKEPLARQLGAAHYIDSRVQDPAAALAQLGGARVILATVPSGEAMRAVLGGLGVNGTLLIVGAADPFEVSPLFLIGGRRSITGWPSGMAIDSQDTLAFSVLWGVRSMNEVFPLERASEAYARMMAGAARFRAVLTTGR
jgi:D-arabinose 1-dehydrogenase-like Zn-dependent alcohol dehydrogenase